MCPFHDDHRPSLSMGPTAWSGFSVTPTDGFHNGGVSAASGRWTSSPGNDCDPESRRKNSVPHIRTRVRTSFRSLVGFLLT